MAAKKPVKRTTGSRPKRRRTISPVVSHPKDIVDAYEVLVAYGVDPISLRKLVAYRMMPDDWTAICNTPEKIMEAFNVLSGKPHLIGAGALTELIKNRKLAAHRPRKLDHDARLLFSIERYKQEHKGIGDKGAIVAVLEESSDYKSMDEEERLKMVQLLQVRLSRFRRLQKPHK